MAVVQPDSSSAVFKITQLPEFTRTAGSLVPQLAHYLQKLMDGAPIEAGCQFPSIHHLTGFLGCTRIDLLNSLLTLRLKGYEYTFISIHSALKIWKTQDSGMRRPGYMPMTQY